MRSRSARACVAVPVQLLRRTGDLSLPFVPCAVDNLVAHLSDPWGSTILSNLSDVFVWQWTADSALSNSGAAPFLSGAGPSLPGVLSF